jgi:hypothetical protein
MADCKLTGKCPLFNDKMNIDKETVATFKAKFCHGDNSDCARYTLFKNGKSVPPDLLPDMMDKAKDIIAGK